MVDEAVYFSACNGKIRHATYPDAAKQLKQGKKNIRPGSKALKLQVYQCTFCGGFHIGNNRKVGYKNG